MAGGESSGGEMETTVLEQQLKNVKNKIKYTCLFSTTKRILKSAEESSHLRPQNWTFIIQGI